MASLGEQFVCFLTALPTIYMSPACRPEAAALIIVLVAGYQHCTSPEALESYLIYAVSWGITLMSGRSTFVVCLLCGNALDRWVPLKKLDSTSHTMTFNQLVSLQALHEECAKRAFIVAYSTWLGAALIDHRLAGLGLFGFVLAFVFMMVYVGFAVMLISGEYCERMISKMLKKKPQSAKRVL